MIFLYMYKNISVEMMKHYKSVVVGAGCAGLSFASMVSPNSTLIIDMGKPINQRDRYDPASSLIGQGGAGHFNDGKYSGFPSGTKVWQIENIEESYNLLNEDLSSVSDIIIPGKREIKDFTSKKIWKIKEYPSYYLSLDERTKLVGFLTTRAFENGNKILYNSRMIKTDKDGDRHVILIQTGNKIKEVTTDNLIYAGGRFSSLFMDVNKTFRRIEFGTRLIFPNSEDLFNLKHLQDPKFIMRRGDVEYRTFCWCRKGEVILTDFDGISSYSGRADCEPTNFTNFGFMMRLSNPKYMKNLNRILNCEPFTKSYGKVMRNEEIFDGYMGKYLSKLYKYGLSSFISANSMDTQNIVLKGPVIEGIGMYPFINKKTLEVIGERNTYVMGDASGIFRGIIPAMLSGYSLGMKF